MFRELLLASLLPLGLTAADDWQPALWKISSPNNSIYLLGSIHVGTPQMYPLPWPIDDRFAAASVLLVETYSGDSAPVTAFPTERALYPPGDSLWKHIGKEARARLTEFRKRENVDLSLKDIGRLRPWAVALTISLVPALSNGMDPDLGLDRHFIELAERAGASKRIVPIETADFQYRLLSGFSDELQVRWLESSLGLDGGSLDEIDKALGPDRNPHMADVAEQFLNSRDQAFMVVGSGHVDGDQGIVHLLEKRGYTAERVPLFKHGRWLP